MHSKDCPDCEFRSRARASCASAGRPTQRRLARPPNGFAPGKPSADFRISSRQPAGAGTRRTRPGVRKTLLGRAMPCFFHLLTFRSGALESYGSAKRRAICVSSPLQSRKTADRPTCIWNQQAGSWHDIADVLRVPRKTTSVALACDRHKSL